MTLLETLAKDGVLTLNPAGRQGDSDVVGTVSATWFAENFPDLAQAETPLSESNYEKLKSIDEFWKKNAERWRSEGLI